MGSIAIISAAIVITFTGYTRADSIASIPIFGDDHPRAWSLLRDVVDVLLEAIQRSVDLDEVRGHLGMPVLSAHMIVDQAYLAQGPLW